MRDYETVADDTDVMKVERYSHVMHITSNVTGPLQPGRSRPSTPSERAPRPAPSQGAPKVRAMQIIDEVEPQERRPGVTPARSATIDFTGNLDTAIALRTLVMREGIAYIQAGSGIVADSQPAEEYQESLNKARALLRALNDAEVIAASMNQGGGKPRPYPCTARVMRFISYRVRAGLAPALAKICYVRTYGACPHLVHSFIQLRTMGLAPALATRSVRVYGTCSRPCPTGEIISLIDRQLR